MNDKIPPPPPPPQPPSIHYISHEEREPINLVGCLLLLGCIAFIVARLSGLL